MARLVLSRAAARTRTRRRQSAGVFIEAMEPRQLLSVSFYQGPGLTGGAYSVVADLNGDAKPDVVNFNPSLGQVKVFTDLGKGTFAPAIDLPVSGGVDNVAVGDFNGDGVPDIAVANATNTVSVYLGAGVNVNGTNPQFLAPVVTTFSTLSAGSIKTAHFGGTSDDLVMDTTSTVYGSGVVCVLLSTGGGHFAEPDAANFLANHVLLQTEVETDVPTFVVADLNGDGISDIAFNGVTVQFGAIGGSFLTSQYNYPVPDGASGDIDAAVLTSGGGKNLPDLIVESGGLSGSPVNDVSVLLNNGGGSFAPAVAYPVDSSVFEAVGDFDGNGSLDIAAGSQVLLNTGAGTFSPAQDDNLPNISIASLDTLTLEAADFNGDAHADLLVNGGDVFFEGTNPNGGGGGGGGSGSNTSPLTPVVGKDTLPKAAVAGGSTHGQVTVSVTNSGSTTSTGFTSVAIYASSDGTIDSNSILLGTLRRKVVLKAHAHSAIVVSIKSLPASLNGTYTILAKVTDPSQNTAVSSTGATLTASAPFISFAEIIARSTLAASDASGKTKASVQLKITNNGNITSTGKSTVALYLSPDTTAASGTLIRSVSQSIPLKPGKSGVLNIQLKTLPAVAAGAYHVVIQVTDPKGDITSVASSGTFAMTS